MNPRIENRAHPAAWLAALRFGSVPIMAIGRTVWWPGAPADLAGGIGVGRLQHELQHLLDFAQGRLSVISYLTHPRNWTYRWRDQLHIDWDRLGAEQRAEMAEALWHAERTPSSAGLASVLRARIPWSSRGAA